MRKQQIQNAAFEVAAQVRTVEGTIDTALAEIAELQARIMRANAAAGSGVATAHRAIEQLTAALGGLVNARGAMGNCHAALVEAKDRVPGLRTTSFGDGTECPPQEGFGNLRVVA
jgi:hypothetical protein